MILILIRGPERNTFIYTYNVTILIPCIEMNMINEYFVARVVGATAPKPTVEGRLHGITIIKSISVYYGRKIF